MCAAVWRWTSRADGDFADPTAAPEVAGAPAAWTWLSQPHGAQVVTVSRPAEHAGAAADAAVTATPGCALVVRTADCAPVVLVAEASVGIVHAGWRGLHAGVISAAVEALTAVGGHPERAVLGPCIRPGCYEFGADDLDAVAARFGDSVRATTSWGSAALDLPAAVRAACEEAGVATLVDESGCTACDRRWFSHRARRERGRCATIAWLEPGP